MEDLAFGKYGWFVWPAIVLFVVVIGGLTLQTVAASILMKRRLRALERGAKPGP